ncbi:MAG TPA: Ig-like domain-containing protein, partial [Candidatus Kryptonia bacterium]|nr:Ig-like domain-containing protein [Candidatus Kryptonia bacterium]
DGDYSVFSLLPPYNTIEAQLIDPNGLLVRDPAGVSLSYQAVADLDGSINSTSAGKTNFWQFVQPLFGVSPAVDAGLAGASMPGVANQPQPMTFDSAAGWFIAEGIPITPFDDAHNPQSYPLMRLVARDGGGAVLATTDVVLPVSDEMNCVSCHASNSSPSAQPRAGWVDDPDSQRDMRLNILLLHDDRESGTPAFQNALTTAGYNAAGLFATVTTDGKPILCARCHASEALPGSGIAGIEPLTLAVHRRMASTVDPVTGGLLDDSDNRSACYRCHPGAVTRCLRGAMGNAVAADGSRAIQCQSCHGSMRDVAAATRTGWLDEPVCQSCHTGTAVNNNGQIRFLSAFESPGQPRVAVDPTFSTNPDTPSGGHSLYRFSTGHGGLKCEACHGSTHAEFPSAQRNDNVQSVALQGHAGVLAECTVCHASQPNTVSGGPHGMHPIGQAWVSRHSDAVEGGGDADVGSGNVAQCQACHGADYRGTELSRAQADRTLNTEFGVKRIWRGAQIGCFTCHQGPFNSDANPNHAPQVDDASASTASDLPVAIALSSRDPDGDSLALRIVSQPSHGTAGLDGANATYFPDPGFSGSDSFTFAAWDGSTESNLGNVSVSVSAAAAVATPTAAVTVASAATVTPIRTPSGCVGDCYATDKVTVDELVLGVNIALGTMPMQPCTAFDCNHNGHVTIDCLVQAVNAALNGCGSAPISTATEVSTPPATPTPTPTQPIASTPTIPAPTPTATGSANPDATLANIQTNIFSVSCVDLACHSSLAQAGGLVLEPGKSHDQLVGVTAFNFAAQQAGLLRVKPGDPTNSFLMVKLTGPSPAQGSPMPFGKAPLTAAQLQLIRDWITAGAQP